MKSFFLERWTTIVGFWGSQALPVFDWRLIFSWDFWTETNLSGQSPYYLAGAVIVAAAIGLLLLWRAILVRRHRQTPVYDWPINHLTNLIVFIVLGLVSYWFFRSQEISYLSSRLVVLSIIAISICWLALIAWRVVRTIPREAERYLERERFIRYIPKRKKKE